MRPLALAVLLCAACAQDAASEPYWADHPGTESPPVKYEIAAGGVQCPDAIRVSQFGTSSAEGPGPDTVICDYPCSASNPAVRLVFEGNAAANAWALTRWFPYDECR